MEKSSTSWTHEFKPWVRSTSARDDPRIERVPDAYWKQPPKWNRSAGMDASYLGSTERPRVLCTSDVFEDWDGPIVDHNGKQLFLLDDEYVILKPGQLFHGPATISDLRRDLFELIDKTLNLDGCPIHESSLQSLLRTPTKSQHCWTSPLSTNSLSRCS